MTQDVRTTSLPNYHNANSKGKDYTFFPGIVRGDKMVVRVRVRNAETGATVDMELEMENTVEEIIEGVSAYWEKDPGAYVIRKGRRLLRGQQKVQELEIQANEELELIPDPEGGNR